MGMLPFLFRDPLQCPFVRVVQSGWKFSIEYCGKVISRRVTPLFAFKLVMAGEMRPNEVANEPQRGHVDFFDTPLSP
jgi:hypothetical protein